MQLVLGLFRSIIAIGFVQIDDKYRFLQIDYSDGLFQSDGINPS